MSFDEPLKTNALVPESPTKLPDGPLAPEPRILNVLAVPWASTLRVMAVPTKLIVEPDRPSAAANCTDVLLMLKTSALPGPVSPLIVTVPPLPVNWSVPPLGTDPTGLPLRVTCKLVLPLFGVTAY